MPHLNLSPERVVCAAPQAELPAHLPVILKAEELAAMLRVNRKTLYEAVQRGEVPGVIRLGRCLRFHRDTVLAWLDEPMRSSRS